MGFGGDGSGCETSAVSRLRVERHVGSGQQVWRGQNEDKCVRDRTRTENQSWVNGTKGVKVGLRHILEPDPRGRPRRGRRGTCILSGGQGSGSWV